MRLAYQPNLKKFRHKNIEVLFSIDMSSFSKLKACLVSLLCIVVALIPATTSTAHGKQVSEQLQASTSSSHIVPQPNLRSPASISDFSLVSFDDIIQGRFVPLPVSQTHLKDVIEGEQDPYTLLFSDQSKAEAEGAPIIELTHPRSFRSLNALMHRYRHVHIYRHISGPDDGFFESKIVLMRRQPLPGGISIAPGSRVIGLDERISEIEHIRRRYGLEVAWARFHKLFTSLEGIDQAQVAIRTWADIVSSPFVPVDQGGSGIRYYLDFYRMGKFLSLDGRHILGIRINLQGVADHYEQAINEVMPHL